MAELPSANFMLKSTIGTFLDTKHLVLAGLLAIAIFFVVYTYDSRRVEAAEAAVHETNALAAQAAQEARTSAQQNAVIQAQTASQLAQLQAINLKLQASNAVLTQAISAQLAVLAKQKQTDAAMTPTEQSARWHALVPTATVAPTPMGFTVDATGGLATIEDLEELPVQQRQITQLESALDNDNTIIANDETLLAKEQAAHASDVDNDAKQLAAAKADTKKIQVNFDLYRKKTHRALLRAYAFGFATGALVTHALGF